MAQHGAPLQPVAGPNAVLESLCPSDAVREVGCVEERPPLLARECHELALQIVLQNLEDHGVAPGAQGKVWAEVYLPFLIPPATSSVKAQHKLPALLPHPDDPALHDLPHVKAPLGILPVRQAELGDVGEPLDPTAEEHKNAIILHTGHHAVRKGALEPDVERAYPGQLGLDERAPDAQRDLLDPKCGEERGGERIRWSVRPPHFGIPVAACSLGKVGRGPQKTHL